MMAHAFNSSTQMAGGFLLTHAGLQGEFQASQQNYTARPYFKTKPNQTKNNNKRKEKDFRVCATTQAESSTAASRGRGRHLYAPPCCLSSRQPSEVLGSSAFIPHALPPNRSPLLLPMIHRKRQDQAFKTS